MFIGHLPAGYILTKKLQEYFKTEKFFAIGLMASILPDLDIVYFYFVDNRQNLHHGYWIHLPFYWLMISLAVFALIYVLKARTYLVPAIIALSNVFLHLLLDTLVGKIEWFYPFSDRSFSFFDVPVTHGWWIYNFVFHWTFLFEIIVIIWALLILFRKKRDVLNSVSYEKHQSSN